MKTISRLFIGALFASAACVAAASPSAVPQSLRGMPEGQQDATCGAILGMEGVNLVLSMKSTKVDTDSVNMAITKLGLSSMLADDALAQNLPANELQRIQKKVSKDFKTVSRVESAYCGRTAFSRWEGLPRDQQAKISRMGVSMFTADAQVAHLNLNVPVDALPKTPQQKTLPVEFQTMPPMDQDAFCAGKFKKQGLDLILAMKKAGNVDKDSTTSALEAYGYYDILTHAAYTKGITNPVFFGFVKNVGSGNLPVTEEESNFCMGKARERWNQSSPAERAFVVHMSQRFFLQAARKRDLWIPISIMPEDVQDRALAN